MAPISNKGRARADPKKDGNKLWDSDDEETSSDEDFHFMSKKLHENNGELDEKTM